MTNKEAIEILTAKAECIRREVSGTDFACNLRNCDECDLCYAQGTTGEQREAIEMAISALQEQDSKTRICHTCKHNPPSKKWPCVDCDMREPADRWEPKDVPDTNVGGTISRQDAIDVLGVFTQADALGHTPKQIVEALPSAQPESCDECKHLGKWENEVEYGYPSPCTHCKRRARDHYER